MNKKYTSLDKPMSISLRETAIKYGPKSSDLSGVFASIMGNISDEAISRLIKKGLHELSTMSLTEISNIPGVGKTAALRLSAAFELSRRIARTMPEDRVIIKDPGDVATLLMEEMRHYEQEHTVVLLLNTKNYVIRKEIITIGTANQALVHPREIFRTAIKHGAVSIIMVHNHPTGDPTASPEDIEITKKIIEAGKIVGICVLDSVIIGNKSYRSMKAEGMITS